MPGCMDSFAATDHTIRTQSAYGGGTPTMQHAQIARQPEQAWDAEETHVLGNDSSR